MESTYTDRSWKSADGLTLYFRDYPATGPDAAKDRPPVLCLHGLTRNSRDFEGLAPYLAARGWRVIAPDMRGRGKSEYAPQSSSYVVPVYLGDVFALLEQEGIDRFVSIGTSMGGLMTMAMAQMAPDRIAGVVLNDIGPEVDMDGIDKIRTYVGQGRSYTSWMQAARELEEVHGSAFPQFDTDQWLAMAKRTLTLCSNGRIAFDYDMKIAEPFMAADPGAVPPDLWPAFEALAGRPTLLIRGGISNLLTEETFAEMQKRIPDASAIVVPDTGHAPTLDEPKVRTAIDALLARVD